MKKAVITGGTYSGKSSLIELFKKNDFNTIPDIGFEIIEKLSSEMGVKKQREYRERNPAEFFDRVIKRQLRKEENLTETTILDRGVYDYIAMMKLRGAKIPESLVNLTKNVKYDLVFVCDNLKNFQSRKSSGRSLTKEDSIRLRELTAQIYRELGCEIIFVRSMPLKKRFEFVKNHL